jgi:hypothetical protein
LGSRKQRNVVTEVKNKSINNYFIERCAGGPKSRDFWPTVKHSLTNKGSIWKKETILSENDVLITKQECDICNNYLVNVAKNIGNNCTEVDDAQYC